MGSSTIARCGACGYQSDTLLIGGGMRSFNTHEARPVHCARCNAVTTANFKSPTLSCLMCDSSDVTPIAENSPAICPKCGKLELRFQSGGIKWD